MPGKGTRAWGENGVGNCLGGKVTGMGLLGVRVSLWWGQVLCFSDDPLIEAGTAGGTAIWEDKRSSQRGSAATSNGKTRNKNRVIGSHSAAETGNERWSHDSTWNDARSQDKVGELARSRILKNRILGLDNRGLRRSSQRRWHREQWVSRRIANSQLLKAEKRLSKIGMHGQKPLRSAGCWRYYPERFSWGVGRDQVAVLEEGVEERTWSLGVQAQGDGSLRRASARRDIC